MYPAGVRQGKILRNSLLLQHREVRGFTHHYSSGFPIQTRSREHARGVVGIRGHLLDLLLHLGHKDGLGTVREERPAPVPQEVHNFRTSQKLLHSHHF